VTRKATCALAAGFVAAALARAPAAADPLAIRISGSVPFTPGELESALALRAQLASPDAGRQVVASVDGDGPRVRIAVTGRERVMELDAEDGPDAARLVAFAILDLAGDQLDPPSAPPTPAPAPEVAALDPAGDGEDPFTRDTGSAPTTRRPPRIPRAATGIWFATGSRTELVAELGLSIRGPVRAIASAGMAWPETHTAGTAEVTIDAVPVRLGVAYRSSATRVGSFDARLTAIALVHRASGEREVTSAVFGGGAALAWVVPYKIGRGNHGGAFLAGVGVDGFATARDYRVDGAPVATTDRVAWWAGVQLAAELWR
jgi:hypothetical protein